MGNCQNNDKFDVVSPISFNGLKVTCKSWIKTYNNLFDYTTNKQISQTVFQISKSAVLFKKSNQYQLRQLSKDKSQNNDQTAFEFHQNQGIFQFRISKFNQKITKNIPWLVVSSIPSHRYTLQQGDIIRLGKQKLRVKEIIYKDKQQEKQQQLIHSIYKFYDQLNKDSVGTNEPKQSGICRICLQQGQNSNPLISPCKCMGSAKYIHLKCIQQWLTKSINPHTVNKATVITWKPLICQLCATPLPFKIYIDNKKYFTVNIPKPKKPYLVVNPIFKDLQKSKVYFLISFFQKNRLLMGRKKDSDIIISDDASVSRFHTIFQYIENPRPKFIIQDNNSRYGTLVLLRKNLTIKNNLTGISIQIGGDVIKLDYGSIALKQNNEEYQQINQSEINSSSQQQISEQQQQQVQVPQNTQNVNTHQNLAFQKINPPTQRYQNP